MPPATKAKPRPKADPPGAGAPPPAAVPPGCADKVASAVIDRARIVPSPLNPRKHFGDAELDGLAASIGQVGILSRLLVRPVPLSATLTPAGKWAGLDHFELVDGERRWRAAERLGVPEVPVDVRWLTDDQVREVMLVSDVQREHLRPSERAAAAAELVGRLTLEAAAGRVGLTVDRVRDLARLVRLPAWALAAVDRGDLPAATASVVAKLPGEESRKRAAACVLLGLADLRDLEFGDWGGSGQTWEDAAEHAGTGGLPDAGPLSYRATRELVRHFRVELKAAPFSRKALDLVPAAGSCDACPKRAGNDPEARADGARPDVCLDPECYRDKVAAYRGQERQRFAKRHYGSPHASVCTTDEPFRDGRPPRGYCDVGQLITQSELGDGGEWAKRKKDGDTVGDVLDSVPPVGAGVPKYLAFNEKGKARTLVRTADARKRLVAAGLMARPERAKPAAVPPPRSPIEAMIDRACGVNSSNTPAAADGDDPDGPYKLFRVVIDPASFAGIEFSAMAGTDAEALAELARTALVEWIDDGDGRFAVEPVDESGATPPETSPAPDAPDRATLDGGLWAALHSFEEAGRRWSKLRASGATDAELKGQIGEAFGIEGWSSAPGVPPIRQKGGKGPAFWWDCGSRPKSKPTLAGKALIDAARRVLGVPHPTPDRDARDVGCRPGPLVCGPIGSLELIDVAGLTASDAACLTAVGLRTLADLEDACGGNLSRVEAVLGEFPGAFTPGDVARIAAAVRDHFRVGASTPKPSLDDLDADSGPNHATPGANWMGTPEEDDPPAKYKGKRK